MDSPQKYFDFKIQMIDKTYDLYLKRMDIWEEWFFKVKYGCITMVIILLGFKYTYAKTENFINFIALAVTVGLWVFEATLRTTFYRYMAKLDILTEAINNKRIMEKAFETRQLDFIKILDFDLRTKVLRETIKEYIKARYPDKSEYIFKLTEKSLEDLKSNGLNKNSLNKLKVILEKEFKGEKEFQDELKILFSDNLSEKDKSVITKHANEINFLTDQVTQKKQKITTIWSSMNLKNLRVFYGMLILFQIMAIIFFKT